MYNIKLVDKTVMNAMPPNGHALISRLIYPARYIRKVKICTDLWKWEFLYTSKIFWCVWNKNYFDFKNEETLT